MPVQMQQSHLHSHQRLGAAEEERQSCSSYPPTIQAPEFHKAVAVVLRYVARARVCDENELSETVEVSDPVHHQVVLQRKELFLDSSRIEK